MWRGVRGCGEGPVYIQCSSVDVPCCLLLCLIIVGNTRAAALLGNYYLGLLAKPSFQSQFSTVHSYCNGIRFEPRNPQEEQGSRGRR